MDIYLAAASVSIFAVTLFLMVKRPFGLKLGYAAGLGAGVSLLLGTVSVGQAAEAFLDIWDAALAFIGIVALSVTLDALGFFRWAALRVVRLANGSGLRLYFYVGLLTAGVSILFANDSAVLILTPIVLEIVLALRFTDKGRLAYLFSAGLIADTAAMPLITSNPVNIVSADFFGYTFLNHMVFMVPVAVATIGSSMLLVYVFFRKKIPQVYDVGAVDGLELNKRQIPRGLLRVCLAVLVAIDVGYVVASLFRVPVSFVICGGAVSLVVVYWLSLKRNAGAGVDQKGLVGLAKDINWDIVLFMLCIFLVVQGLENVGLVEALAGAFVGASALPNVLGVFVPSLIVTLGASVMNNWPMTILGLLSVEKAAAIASLSAPTFTGLVFSNVIGNNLGPHFFPLGSLAILMWLECMRRKGVNISLKEYLKVGAVLSIVEVLIASLVLWAELSLGFRL